MSNKQDGNGDSRKLASRPCLSTKENDNGELHRLHDIAPCPELICWVEVLCRRPDTPNDSSRRQLKKLTNNSPHMRWVHVDASRELVDQPQTVEEWLYAERDNEVSSKRATKKMPIAYALAAEHLANSGLLRVRLTDVTPRYASSWVDTLKVRGILRGKRSKVKESERVDNWWASTLDSVNHGGFHARKEKSNHLKGKNCVDAIVVDSSSGDEDKKPPAKIDPIQDTLDHHEKEELLASAKNVPLPTSKTAFKTHPIYVIPSILNANEVLVPDAKSRVCGLFKGELVYRRADVETALPAKKWPYKGRKVKDSELRKPIKRAKARKKPTSKSFRALKSYGVGDVNDGSEAARKRQVEMASQPLDDDMEDLYASWQTDAWSPPLIGPDDPIPMNEHKNVELELLNPGLVHVDEPRISLVAKQLGMQVILSEFVFIVSHFCLTVSNMSLLLPTTVLMLLVCLDLKVMVGIAPLLFGALSCTSTMKNCCERPMWKWQAIFYSKVMKAFNRLFILDGKNCWLVSSQEID